MRQGTKNVGSKILSRSCVCAGEDKFLPRVQCPSHVLWGMVMVGLKVYSQT